MGLYSAGLTAPARFLPSAITERIEPMIGRAKLAADGASTFVKAGSRFYDYAMEGRPLFKSGSVDQVKTVVFDAVHFVLVFVGAILMYQAVKK